MSTVQRLVRVGIDLGGTGSRAVAVHDGTIVGVEDCLTADLGKGSVSRRMDSLAAMVKRVVPRGSGLASVGVGASGPLDIYQGTIHNSDTLPWFSGFPFVEELQRRIEVPVAVDNDAVTAAFGEYCQGAGVQCDRLLTVTLGTGVGVAMLIDGQPLRGIDSAHPEGGHIPVSDSPVRCYCGLTGCWEQQASRHSLQQMVGAALGNRPASSTLLAEASAAAARDGAVRTAFRAYGRTVGRGLAALHTLYQPRVTVVGGSAATCFPHFESGMHESLSRTPEFDVPVRIRPAMLGDTAGAIGAAIMLAASTA